MSDAASLALVALAKSISHLSLSTCLVVLHKRGGTTTLSCLFYIKAVCSLGRSVAGWLDKREKKRGYICFTAIKRKKLNMLSRVVSCDEIVLL